VLKVKSIKSHDWCDEPGKEDFIKAQNSALTLYIPLESDKN